MDKMARCQKYSVKINTILYLAYRYIFLSKCVKTGSERAPQNLNIGYAWGGKKEKNKWSNGGKGLYLKWCVIKK